MAKTLAELRLELKTKNDWVTELMTTQDAAGGADKEPLDAPTYKQLIDTNKRIEEIGAEIKELEGQLVEQKAIGDAARARAARMATIVPTVGHTVSDDSANNGAIGRGDVMVKSWGSQVMEAKSLTDYLTRIRGAGEIIGEKTRVNTEPVHLENWTLNRVRQKALVTSTPGGTTGSVLILPDYLPGMVDFPIRPLVMRDVVTVGQTTSDRVEFVRMTDYGTNLAAPVAEATTAAQNVTYGQPGSGQKPESTAPNLARIDAYVRTIAHWLPITKRALSDAPQMRTIVDQFLMNGIDQVFEDEMVLGDGTGEHFTGILNTGGLTQQVYTATGPYPMLTTLRKARTQALLIGRSVPNAILMHPRDWESIDLLTDGEDRYVYGGPANMGVPRIWGLPVVEAQAMPQGTALVGNFKTCVLWDRESAAIQMSDSHLDFFTRNLVAVLAEARAAFGIMRPAAIVEAALA